MQKYLVKKNAELLTYLIEDLGFKRSNAKSLLKYKLVQVNGINISSYDYLLKVNDKLEILDKKCNCPLEIIYEDKDFIAINKPSGLLSMASDLEKDNTAYHLINKYLKSKHEDIYILHRLDKDTSGVLVFAKNKNLRDELQASWNDLVSERKYYAIVEGKLNKVGHLENYLKVTKDKTYVTDNKNDLKAITDYKVIQSNQKYSLLDIDIKTGRKNQIRASLEDIGVGIIGDKKYGTAANPLKRLGLHAYKLTFLNPLNNKVYSFMAKEPQVFEALFKKES